MSAALNLITRANRSSIPLVCACISFAGAPARSCSICRGAGGITGCPTCSGTGMLAGATGAQSVCSACKGQGYLAHAFASAVLRAFGERRRLKVASSNAAPPRSSTKKQHS